MNDITFRLALFRGPLKVSPETHHVGAHFKALIKAILVAPSRILWNFFSLHVTLLRFEY